MMQRCSVFVSYSSTDATIARQLALDLQCANLEVWLDQWSLSVGDAFEQQLEKGVDNAEFIMVLISHASIESKWVEFEWRRKIHHEAQSKQLKIIPVQTDKAAGCQMPDFLAERSTIDISTGSYPLGFKQLLEVFDHHTNCNTIKIPQAPVPQQFQQTNLIPVVEPITLAVGSALMPLFEPNEAGYSEYINHHIPAMRNQLISELGFIIPGVRVRGENSNFPPQSAYIALEEISEQVYDFSQQAISLVQAGDYLIQALYQLLKRKASLFLTIDAASYAVKEVQKTQPQLVQATIPKRISWIRLTEILQLLIEDDIGIYDMASILQAIKDSPPELNVIPILVEHIRQALQQQISAQVTKGTQSVAVITLNSQLEQLLTDSIEIAGAERYINLAPQDAQDILAAIRQKLTELEAINCLPNYILTTPTIRAIVRKLVELEFEQLKVLSHNDLIPAVNITHCGEV